MKTRVFLSVLALMVAGLAPIVGRTAGATDVAGIPAASVGDHGPVTDYASGMVELVGHSNVTLPDKPKTLGNNGGVALIGHCAYVGRWHDYGTRNLVNIVDITDPANPVVVPPPAGSPSGTTGAVPGTAIASAVARELRAIDLPPSARFPSGIQMLSILTFSNSVNGGIRSTQNSMLFYTFPSGDCTKPVLAGSYNMNNFRGHEFFQWIDPNPAHDNNGRPRVLEYVTTPLSGTDMIVLNASNPANVTLIGLYNAGVPGVSPTEATVSGVPVGYGKYSHSISISPDGRTAYVSQWDGGYFAADTSDFADDALAPVVKPLGLATVPLPTHALGNTHSAVRIPGTNDIVAGDEIYVTTDGCPFGWMHVIAAGNATTAPSQIGEFKLAENNAGACSGVFSSDRNASGLTVDGTFTMHNPTVTSHYVLTSYYGGGLRVIDVNDPAHPAEAGFFVPKPVDAISDVPDTPAPIYGRSAQTSADDWWVSMFSYPVIRGGFIYIADIRNGLYILRATAGSALETELAGIPFIEGNSNLGTFL